MTVGPGDSLYVLDRSRRLSVFSPSQQFARSVQMLYNPEVIVVEPDGKLVGKMSIATADRAGYNVHVLSSSSELLRSIGQTSEPQLDPRCRACADQRLAPGPVLGTVWIAAANRYSFDLWIATGSVEARYVVKGADWFADWDKPALWLDGSEPKNSSVLRVFGDSHHRIWVYGVHAPSDWSPHLLPPGGALSSDRGAIIGPRAALDDWVFENETKDTEAVIDVIDTQIRSVVVSARIRGEMVFLNASTAYHFTRDAMGEMMIDVYRVSLRQ